MHRILAALCLWTVAWPALAQPTAKIISLHGYDNCIELTNGTTRVVLGPEGGRVLEYSLQGKNALYLEEAETGKPRAASGPASMSAGRFDIGPEKTIPPHPKLWSGKWKGEIAGTSEKPVARLTSQEDEATGTQLVREFRLADNGTHLACTQTIKNIGKETTEWCHWSRTFARGNGICLVPLTTPSRFPNRYVMYEDGDKINIRPTDPHIRQRDGFLEIFDVPKFPKLGMDSYAGWFAYLMPGDLLFVKSFPVYGNRVYNEVAGLTLSIWYPENRRVELEPIGPLEHLTPGESASFTEDWHLLSFPFPADRQHTDLSRLRQAVSTLTRPPGP